MFEPPTGRPLGSADPVAAVPAAPTRPRNIAALFEAEESALLHFALGIVHQRTVAEELVQDAFLRLHKVWDQVENPRGWVYRCLRNLALNALRDRPRETVLGEEPASPDERLPRETLARNEAIGTVRMLLSEMAEEDRDLIRLKFLEELPYEEISRRTGLSVSNVGFRLHRVLKQLLGRMHRAGIEGSEG